MDDLLAPRNCKYCQDSIKPCLDEGLRCSACQENVHIQCLKRGTVPGGLQGDLFYTFTCQECSDAGTEKFVRDRLSWLQAIVLTLYHLHTKSPGLSRNGFFHWRNHIVAFIDRNWEVLFPNVKQSKKKRWVGTVSGRLSHYSTYLFLSGGKTVFNKPAWWSLVYPKITPFVLSSVYNVMTVEKQKAKIKNEKKLLSDGEHFKDLLTQYIQDEDLTQTVDLSNKGNIDFERVAPEEEPGTQKPKIVKRKIFLPSYTETSKKLIKLAPSSTLSLTVDTVPTPTENHERPEPLNVKLVEQTSSKESTRLVDPMCYYNTSLNNISRMKMQKMHVKLTGGVRKEMILSPYSGIYLKPYIRRDTETFPTWLKLMAELQIISNENNSGYVLPPRAPIDYTYVQPEHIPAINSLCNQFFWPGIDLTDSLQYPDFSCVTLYKRLIVGFAFLVPDVKHTENYISFVFTRPGWRNCGIGKFMVYHLIQTSLGRDITLHVSIDNPALFLYQKFGFKVENVALDFYDKYFRSDVKESKHAFFCRLER